MGGDSEMVNGNGNGKEEGKATLWEDRFIGKIFRRLWTEHIAHQSARLFMNSW